MDLIQIILISAIVILAIFLVVIGFQAFFVLKDLRKTIKKTNRLLDSSDELVTDVRKPIETIENAVSLFSGRKLGYILHGDSNIKSGREHSLSTFMAGFVLSEALTHLFGSEGAARLKKEILKEGGNLLEDVKEKIEEAGEKIEEGAKEVKVKAQEKIEEIKESVQQENQQAPKLAEHPPKKRRHFFFRKSRQES